MKHVSTRSQTPLEGRKPYLIGDYSNPLPRFYLAMTTLLAHDISQPNHIVFKGQADHEPHRSGHQDIGEGPLASVNNSALPAVIQLNEMTPCVPLKCEPWLTSYHNPHQGENETEAGQTSVTKTPKLYLQRRLLLFTLIVGSAKWSTKQRRMRGAREC